MSNPTKLAASADPTYVEPGSTRLSARVAVRPAQESDVAFVEQHLRPADFEEFVMAAGRHPKGRFVAAALRSDELTVGLLDGIPACVFGVVPFDGFAVPWMVGTPAIEGLSIGRTLVAHGRKLLAEWQEKYGSLRNHVYALNDLHIRYIKALGCEVGPPHPHGALGAPFREFTFKCAPRYSFRRVAS